MASLRDAMVWFSSPDGLNDPFDSNCRIDTRVPIDEQQQLKHQMFLFCVEMNNALGGQETTSVVNAAHLPENLKFSWACKEFARWAFQSAIYSLTEDPLHPLMWAHYSGSYAGFVIEFDTTREHARFWFAGPRAVQYVESPPSIHVSDLVDRDGVKYGRLEEFEQSILFTKSSKWTYEAEWRLVAGRTSSALQFQPYEISRILFGYRMPQEQRDEVTQILGARVQYVAVVPDLLTYSLRIIDLAAENDYLRDFDRALRTLTNRTDFIGTADFLRHHA